MPVRCVNNAPLRHTCVKIIHIVVNHIPADKSAVQGVGDKACFRAAACSVVWPVDQEEIVFSVDFIDMRTFVPKPDFAAVVGHEQAGETALFRGSEVIV